MGTQFPQLSAIRIYEDIYLIKCPYLHYFTSVLAILGDVTTLVDVGVPSSPQETILPFLKAFGRDERDVSHIVLTHSHFDHCGGAQPMKRISGAEVIIHESDSRFAEDPNLIYQNLTSRFPSLDLPGIFPTNSKPAHEPISIDRTVRNGDRLKLSGHDFEVIHLPGHSAGCICLAEKKLGLYFVNDAIQGRGKRRPLIFHSASEYAESLATMVGQRPQFMILGHPFPPFCQGVLQREQAQTHLDHSIKAIVELESRVLEVLSGRTRPWSIGEIQGRIPEAWDISIGCILEKLQAEGRAQSVPESGDYVWTHNSRRHKT